MERRGIHMGDPDRLKSVLKKAKDEKDVVLGFLGGSITQGSLSSTPQTCYAYLVYQWWKKTFPKAGVTYINAGIGGTSSLFGAVRCREDILMDKPDLVIVDFTVNDEDTDFFMETYESLMRRLLNASPDLAVLALCNVFYGDGRSAWKRHRKVLKQYGIPYVSMKETLYQDICDGQTAYDAVTPDGLHPNDRGHRRIADLIVRLLEEIPFTASHKQYDPAPITQCRYEAAERIHNLSGICQCHGFQRDDSPKKGVTDVFKGGWFGYRKGASLRMEATGSCLAVQYRKTITGSAPVAAAYVDGDREHGTILNGNFEENWGDSAVITSLLHHGSRGRHQIDIEITEGVEEDKTPFYLICVIQSGEM